MSAGVADCALCGLSTSAPDVSEPVVFEQSDWMLTTFPGFDVPGWYFLQSRAHVRSLDDLSFGALQGFGPMLAASVEAIRRATRCDKVYIYRFGETHEHWHLLLAARPEGIPDQFRGARFFIEKERFRNSLAAREIAGRVGDEVARIVEIQMQGRS
jgi:diadenosine tetraphosphate (Ap4A) HIT family hydrolase